MAKILILGGTGYTGKLVTGHLLRQSDAEITLASRHPEKTQLYTEKFNQEFPGNRVNSVFADAADKASLCDAFMGHDMIVVAAPTTAFAENVVNAVIESGADYLDVQLSASKFALLQSYSGKIKDSGLCFITEAGFHPGLPAALVHFAAQHFDTLETANTIGYLNMGKGLPYTEAVDELVECFREYQAQVYINGQWTNPEKFQMKKFDFGSDIGIKTCYSMFFEELRPLPDVYPSLKETGFYMSESHWMTDYFIMPLVWFGLKVFPNSVRTIGKLLWWGMGNFHNSPYRVELQVHASGIKTGQPHKLVARVSHSDGYELTAIPVVATLLQYLSNPVPRPGLWMMGYYADPVRLMDDMKKMGVEVMA